MIKLHKLNVFNWFTNIYAGAKNPNITILFSDGLAHEQLTDRWLTGLLGLKIKEWEEGLSIHRDIENNEADLQVRIMEISFFTLKTHIVDDSNFNEAQVRLWLQIISQYISVFKALISLVYSTTNNHFPMPQCI